MHILVINAGSSSVKFDVFDVAQDSLLFKDEIEHIGAVNEALQQIPIRLQQAKYTDVHAIGHRVAHGGSHFQDAVHIDDTVVQAITECIPLAPLHNPSTLAGIQMARNYWPSLPQVAVFDTAFHQTMPHQALTYAVPETWRAFGLRRYGFHGTSHKYIMQRVAQELRVAKNALRIISCHLGNGASICAIKHGVSIDTSMGMTPLEGLIMGTRSGDVDPGLFTFVQRQTKLSAQEIENELYHNSGLKALSGVGNDLRDIEKQAAFGDTKARLAIEIFVYRARKYIGAYIMALGGCDVLAFTGGIGEHSALVRSLICQDMEFIDLHFDQEKNQKLRLQEFEAPQLQQAHSRVKVMVTQAREQWMIAQETARII